MTALVTDELLDELAVEAAPSKLAAAITERFDGVLDRVGLYAPYEVEPATWADTVA